MRASVRPSDANGELAVTPISTRSRARAKWRRAAWFRPASWANHPARKSFPQTAVCSGESVLAPQPGDR